MKSEEVFFPLTRFALSMMFPDAKDEGSTIVLLAKIVVGVFMVPAFAIIDCVLFMPLLILMHIFGR